MDSSDVEAIYNYKNDSLLTRNLKDSVPDIKSKMKSRLKAIIQQYNDALINNRMSAQ
jgi:hypothetical protein